MVLVREPLARVLARVPARGPLAGVAARGLPAGVPARVLAGPRTVTGGAWASSWPAWVRRPTAPRSPRTWPPSSPTGPWQGP